VGRFNASSPAFYGVYTSVFTITGGGGGGGNSLLTITQKKLRYVEVSSAAAVPAPTGGATSIVWRCLYRAPDVSGSPGAYLLVDKRPSNVSVPIVDRSLLTLGATYHYKETWYQETGAVGGVGGVNGVETTLDVRTHTYVNASVPPAPTIAQTTLNQTTIQLNIAGFTFSEDSIEVEVSENGGAFARWWKMLPDVKTIKKFGFLPGGAYQLRVRGVSAAGAGAYSNILSFSMPSASGVAPPALVVSTAKARDSSRVDCEIANIQQSNLAIRVELSTDGGTSWVLDHTLPALSNETIIVDRTASQACRIRMFAISAGGVSAPSNVQIVSTLATGQSYFRVSGSPSLFLTPALQDSLDAMALDYDPGTGAITSLAGLIFKQVKLRADSPGTAYYVIGQDAFVEYFRTGNSAFAVDCYNEMVKHGPPIAPLSLANFGNQTAYPGFLFNWVREHWADYLIFALTIMPALNATQQNTLKDLLFAYWKFAAVLSTDTGGVRTGAGGGQDGDSDQGSMHLWATLLMVSSATSWGRDEWKTLAWDQYADQLGTTSKFGGFVGTAPDRSSLVNTYSTSLANMVKKGHWVEGSEYNPSTRTFVMVCLMTLLTSRSFEGDYADYHGDIIRALRYAPLNDAYFKIPNKIGATNQGRSWKFQDDANVFAGNNGYIDGIANMLLVSTRFSRGIVGLGDVATSMIDLWYAENALGLNSGGAAYRRALSGYRKTLPKATLSDLPRSWVTGDKGTAWANTGFAEGNSAMMVRASPEYKFDHYERKQRGFAWYINGERVIRQVIAYDSFLERSVTDNAWAIAGVNNFNTDRVLGDLVFYGPGERGIIADKYWGLSNYYVESEAYGQSNWVGGYERPLQFCHEGHNHDLWIGNVKFTHSRLYAQNPKLMAHSAATPTIGIGPFNPDAPLINAAEGLFEHFWQIENTPTVISAKELQWTTDGGTQVNLHTLFPVGATRTIVNQSSAFGGSNVAVGERRFHAKIVPSEPWPTTDTPAFERFLAVHTVGLEYIVTPLSATDFVGAQVTKSGVADVIALFHSQSPSGALTALNRNRRRTTSASVSFTQANASATMQLVGLDPAVAWTYSINSGAAQTFAVPPEGIAEITLIGAGAKTFTLLAGGVAPPPPVATSPTNLTITEITPNSFRATWVHGV
jgi:hypothetical protein